MDRDSMAEIMALPAEQIRIVPTACGGGFGSKLDISMQPYVGLAAWILKKPVRIAYSRTESMQSTTKRHPSDITLRIGADRDGKITAFDFHGDFNTGAYASWGPTVANRVPVHASGPYFIENYRARSRAIHTHLPPAGAFRGFGVPQSAFAQESILDDIALQLGLDRLAIRRLNALKNGEPTVTGQMFEKGVGIGQCLDALAPHWDRALAEADAVNAASGVKRRGVGIASGWYGCGNTSLPNPSTIRAGFKADGALVLHQGATDIGQGANTVITQIFATALGLPVDAITRLAGEALRAEILRLANCSDAAAIAISGAHLIVSEGVASRTIDLASLTSNDLGYVLFAEKTYDPPTKALDANGQGEPYAVYGYAAHLVELEVDIEIGTVKLLKFTAAHDVGKAINPVLVEGQVHGGIAQGLGMALMEDYIPGVTENLHDYLIPGFGDVPEIETLIIEDEDMHGPYGAKGLGEHVLIPTAPAIVNAIRHATGARIFDLPATPTRILTALGKIG
jgi:CO/xanthine dehydrogenase Mo-binding subunit